MLRRWRERRLENAEADLVDACARLSKLRGMQFSFGGRARRILEGERAVMAQEAKVQRLRARAEGGEDRG